MPSSTSLLIDRSELTKRIVAAAKDGSRLVLLGRSGAGKFSALKTAMDSLKRPSRVWDLRFVSREPDLQHLAGGNFGTVVREMDKSAKKNPMALLIRNLDGCARSPEQDGIMGLLRSELQGCHYLSIFYTAENPDFVGRHFAAPTAAFFKQATILPVGDLTDQEFDILTGKLVAPYWDGAARRQAVEAAGLRACDAALLLSGMRARRVTGPEQNQRGRISIEEVGLAVRDILRMRAAVYDELLTNRMTLIQRTILRAAATGMKLKADAAMAEATGITKGSLTSTLRFSLLKQGWLIRRDDRLEFADPFLRCYLSGRFR